MEIEPTNPSQAAPEDELPLRRGDAIDRFTALETLGVGGMGVVVSAYDCDLDRKVALKVLRPDRAALEPEQGRTRLLREAQAMARLTIAVSPSTASAPSASRCTWRWSWSTAGP